MTTVVVTRPAREAVVWVQALEAAGFQAQALPLIDIAEPPEPLALQAMRARSSAYSALMFVSAQAVERFWAVPGPGPVADGSVRYWAPGPGTAQALQRAQVKPECIDVPPATAGQYDSEALWAVVSPQVVAGHRLLCVRGVSADGHPGRDWLIRQCEAVGGQCDSVVAYSRRVPVWSDSEQARVRQWAGAESSSPVVWLLSSSEALSNLRALCPGVSWAGAMALTTHPRIEQAAQAAGFGRTFLCRPALADVLARLESLQ